MLYRQVSRSEPLRRSRDNESEDEVKVTTGDDSVYVFDHVIICRGHYWPLTHEDIASNYFDSPYTPPIAKLLRQKLYSSFQEVRPGAI
jgi:cation diffusion facilitator CzcD-associated flavoprotein CzcO